ncbi:hypothetical protein LOTGIDRAFT_232129 [Lottia gigantea]|uniref:Uncharacterized protein n=1 Tax=Lottia gigantea TaxID=225164 RepID=V4ADR0_LOTGI|nr:hypothetical protein LOTGIDRAFT_232129 [Lottia gigantea]ESO94987.1 hypothetical protein LOTGIDRAFT_232129 [Lottia gigantea]
MDLSRDRSLRRFETALENDLNVINAKVKIFTKNHRFSNRSLRKDLFNMMLSKRKCALNDLDAWENKRQARILERNAAIVKREKIISILEAMTPVKNLEKQSETADLPETVTLPPLTTRSEDTNNSLTPRESIVLPAITVTELTKFVELNRWAKVGCKKIIESKTEETPIPNQVDISLSTSMVGAKSSLKKFSKWKVLSKIIQNDESEDTQIYDGVVLKQKNENSVEEKAPVTGRRGSMATSNSSDDKNEQQVVNKWRRLSILSNGRRNSIRRRSSVGLSASQAVKVFLEAMNKNKAIEEEKSYDLSYLRNCRYLRHSFEDEELYE